MPVDEEKLFQLVREAKLEGQTSLLQRISNFVEVLLKDKDPLTGGPSSAKTEDPEAALGTGNLCAAADASKEKTEASAAKKDGESVGVDTANKDNTETGENVSGEKPQNMTGKASPPSTGSLTANVKAETQGKRTNEEAPLSKAALEGCQPVCEGGGQTRPCGAAAASGLEAVAEDARKVGPVEIGDAAADWVKMLVELDHKPSLGASSRELREFLLATVSAAERDSTACSMQIPQKLRGTLEMLTNRSVIQARRVALNVFEEAMVNTVICSRCGAMRLTSHKIADPEAFYCGHAECLFPDRPCKSASDTKGDWVYTPRTFPGSSAGEADPPGRSGPYKRARVGRAAAGAAEKRSIRDDPTAEDEWFARASRALMQERLAGGYDKLGAPWMPIPPKGHGASMYGVGDSHAEEFHGGRRAWPSPPAYPPFPGGFPQDWQEIEHMRQMYRRGDHLYDMPGAEGMMNRAGFDSKFGGSLGGLHPMDLHGEALRHSYGLGRPGGGTGMNAMFPGARDGFPEVRKGCMPGGPEQGNGGWRSLYPDDAFKPSGRSQAAGWDGGAEPEELCRGPGSSGRASSSRLKASALLSSMSGHLPGSRKGKDAAPFQRRLGDPERNQADSGEKMDDSAGPLVPLGRGSEYPPGDALDFYAAPRDWRRGQDRDPPYPPLGWQPGFPHCGAMHVGASGFRTAGGVLDTMQGYLEGQRGDARSAMVSDAAAAMGFGPPSMFPRGLTRDSDMGSPNTSAHNGWKRARPKARSPKADNTEAGADASPWGAAARTGGPSSAAGNSPGGSSLVPWRAEVHPPDTKEGCKMVLFKLKAQIPSWLAVKLPSVLPVKGFTPRNTVEFAGAGINPLMLELDDLMDQQRLDLNMMIVDQVAIMCELPELHLALVPHRNQYASLHLLGFVIPKGSACGDAVLK